MLHPIKAQTSLHHAAPSVLPVIHYLDDAQALRNARIAYEAGCEGIFLIHMEGRNELLWTAGAQMKQNWPAWLVGINHLGIAAHTAIEANIAAGFDMTWTDEQITHSAAPIEQAETALAAVGKARHDVFVGVAFKHQQAEPDPGKAARKALEYGFIPTTSGPATGIAATQEAIDDLRDAIGPDAPFAIASGITPANIRLFAPQLTHVLVATGISSSFYEFDAEKLGRLMKVIHP